MSYVLTKSYVHVLLVNLASNIVLAISLHIYIYIPILFYISHLSETEICFTLFIVHNLTNKTHDQSINQSHLASSSSCKIWHTKTRRAANMLASSSESHWT